MTDQAPPRLPPGIWNAHLFQWFNTISFSIALGAPMILFFKGLGASATVLGLAAALSPLFATLQIPAAHYLEKVGYRSFVLRGWATRSFFIVGLMAVALLPARFSAGLRMGLTLALLAAFAAARGISSCGYLPWMTQLIPEGIRGRFVARDYLASALAALLTMILLAWWLGAATGRTGFAGAFAASYLAALASLVFLRRIPDVPVPPRPTAARAAVPWLAMLRHPPFLRLVTYNVVVFVALSGAGVFWVPLLRDRFHVPNGEMLWFAAIGCAAMSLGLVLFGRLVDKVGSRPLLALAGLCFVVGQSGWACVAAGLLPFRFGIMALVITPGGLGVALFNIGSIKLAMGTVPEMGRSHFFALYSVAISLTQGLLPIFWGGLLDGLGSWHTRWGPWDWNQYSVLYATLVGVHLVGLALRTRLTEPRAMSTEQFLQELVDRTRVRSFASLLFRRPPA